MRRGVTLPPPPPFSRHPLVAVAPCIIHICIVSWLIIIIILRLHLTKSLIFGTSYVPSLFFLEAFPPLPVPHPPSPPPHNLSNLIAIIIYTLGNELQSASDRIDICWMNSWSTTRCTQCSLILLAAVRVWVCTRLFMLVLRPELPITATIITTGLVFVESRGDSFNNRTCSPASFLFLLRSPLGSYFRLAIGNFESKSGDHRRRWIVLLLLSMKINICYVANQKDY